MDSRGRFEPDLISAEVSEHADDDDQRPVRPFLAVRRRKAVRDRHEHKRGEHDRHADEQKKTAAFALDQQQGHQRGDQLEDRSAHCGGVAHALVGEDSTGVVQHARLARHLLQDHDADTGHQAVAVPPVEKAGASSRPHSHPEPPTVFVLDGGGLDLVQDLTHDTVTVLRCDERPDGGEDRSKYIGKIHIWSFLFNLVQFRVAKLLVRDHAHYCTKRRADLRTCPNT